LKENGLLPRRMERIRRGSGFFQPFMYFRSSSRAAAELSTPPLMAAAVISFIEDLHGHNAENLPKVYHICPPLATKTPGKTGIRDVKYMLYS